MLKCGQDTFCAGFKDKSFVSHWNIFFRAIEADGGVHHGTYHRLNIDSSLKSEIKVCQFGTRYLICKPFPQQVWERILHHLLLPALAHRHPPLPCHCHLRYQVRTFSLSHISIIFGILHFDPDACAQITEIYEAVNPAESAKSQLLDAPCRRWGTGYYPKLISHSLILSKEGLILTLSILPCPQGWISWSIPVDGLMMRRMSLLHQNLAGIEKSPL